MCYFWAVPHRSSNQVRRIGKYRPRRLFCIVGACVIVLLHSQASKEAESVCVCNIVWISSNNIDEQVIRPVFRAHGTNHAGHCMKDQDNRSNGLCVSSTGKNVYRKQKQNLHCLSVTCRDRGWWRCGPLCPIYRSTVPMGIDWSVYPLDYIVIRSYS